jgi:hypothetical protein
MNLREVANLFAPFGYTSEEVRSRLSSGDSVFNAYQGLKLELELRWNEWPEDEKTDERIKNFGRIMNIHLKSAIRTSDIRKEKEARRKKMLAKFQRQLIEESQNRLNQILDNLEAQRDSNPKADEFLKNLEK